MIRPLLLLLAASHVVQAEFKDCPEESACIYHARCSSRAVEEGDEVLATLASNTLEDWASTNCHGAGPVELFLRPLSPKIWNITLINSLNVKNPGIKFGDSLTIMTNETEASFKEDSQDTRRIPIEREAKGKYQLTVESDKKLLDIFDKAPIIYVDEGIQNGSSTSEQPEFWQRVLEMTPCDGSLIIDDCKAGEGGSNCTSIATTRDAAACSQGFMWLKSNNSEWQQLTSVSCDAQKEWSLANENGTVAVPSDKIEIQCAPEEPEPWALSSSGLIPNAQVRQAHDDEEKEKKEQFSLLDSPFTWVGIGIVGLIALVSVALAGVYAYRKLWKNPPPEDKSAMSKVSFTQLPQEPSAAVGSDSDNEAEPVKAEPSVQQKPTPSPQPSSDPAPSKADTVNRLSMIKTIKDDSKMAAIPSN